MKTVTLATALMLLLSLPSAGYRSSTSVNSVGSYGCYWSSSYNNNVYAYYVRFLSGTVYPQYSNGARSNGRSVRLIRDV